MSQKLQAAECDSRDVLYTPLDNIYIYSSRNLKLSSVDFLEITPHLAQRKLVALSRYSNTIFTPVTDSEQNG